MSTLDNNETSQATTYGSVTYGRRDAHTTTAFSTLMRNVYTWMALALLATDVTSMYVASSEDLINLIFSSEYAFWGLLISQFVLAMVFTSLLNKMSFSVAATLFGAYALLTGATLSFIFLLYTSESIASTFFITAGTFGAMSLFGYVTKRDLSMWGRYLMMGLFGIIIASVVNFFMKSNTLMWVTTYVGVLIFVGITAYDTQKIKQMLLESGEQGVNENTMKIALYGSFILYLDFINLFLKLLRILGRKK